MSNTLTALLPSLITKQSINLLRAKSGLIGRVRVETRHQNQLEGGDTVTITKQAGAFTPTVVSYASAASAQAITIPSASLTFANHYEVKVSANELESRISQGNLNRVLDETIPGMIEGLAVKIDQSLAALYTSASDAIGVAGAPVTDDLIRQGLGILAENKVPMDMPGHCNLVVSANSYYNDLLAIDRYVLANQQGNQQALRGGIIPSQYGMTVDFTQNLTTASGVHGLLWHRDAMTIGFLEFERANKYSANAPVEEEILTDPETGLSLRTQKYYDPELRTWFYQIDCKWGVVVTDADRMVDIVH